MAVLDALERKEGFTAAEAEVADYILAHPDEVARGGIAELAVATFTSNATIIRLCRKVGVTGFRELRVELSSDAEKRRRAASVVDPDWPFDPSMGSAGVMSGLAALMKDAIDSTYALLRPGDIDRVARCIRRAGAVYLFAGGDSQMTGLAFGNMLIKIGIPCIDAMQYGESIAHASMARSGDVGLFISYSGGSFQSGISRHAIDLMRERRAVTVAITAGEKPAGVDYLLPVPPREGTQSKAATFHSQTCIRYLLNCLYATVFSFDFDESHELRDRATGLIG